MLVFNNGQRLFVRLACRLWSKAVVSYGIVRTSQPWSWCQVFCLMSGVAVRQVTIRLGTP